MTLRLQRLSAQAGWCSFGKSFNLTALVEGHQQPGSPVAAGKPVIKCPFPLNVLKAT